MKKSIEKTSKILLASTIALTSLSFGVTSISHENQAQAKGKENPTNPKAPDTADIKKIDVKYSKAEVKKINDQYSKQDGGAKVAFDVFINTTLARIAPELGISKTFIDIGAANWKKVYAEHFQAAAKKGTGLTITYKVDLNSRTLQGVSFSV